MSDIDCIHYQGVEDYVGNCTLLETLCESELGVECLDQVENKSDRERIVTLRNKLRVDAGRLAILSSDELNVSIQLTYAGLIREFKHQDFMLTEILKRMPEE
tara:strand:- start:988 stop:1293 length:306 start_codon:yes stop_codon:yes gene_type:complete